MTDAGRRLADPHLSLGGGVLRLEDFLLRPERLDPRLERLLRLDQLLLLGLELLHLLVEGLRAALGRRLPRERLAREILAVGRERLRLPLELVDFCSSFCVCSSSRFFAVTTSAIPRLTF